MKHDLTSQTFGRWTVKERAPSRPDHSMWRCRCACGTERDVYQISLLNGSSRSCGCLHREMMASLKTKHGLHASREYRVWADMVDRCRNPKSPGFENYGGRGIRVCPEWQKSFEAFYRDMGRRPSDAYSIERINNDQGYSARNCRWATRTEQSNNMRSTKRITFKGQCLTLRGWSEKTGIPLEALRSRHKRQWPPERMFAEVQKRIWKAA